MVTDINDEGITLDDNYDFELTNTRDIKTGSGIEKLISDLSYQLSKELDSYVGETTSREMAIDLTADAQRVLENDERVLSVTDTRLLKTDDRSSLHLEYTVVSVFGQFTATGTISE